MAVFKSVRNVAINGGVAGLAVEFQRTKRIERNGRAERRANCKDIANIQLYSTVIKTPR